MKKTYQTMGLLVDGCGQVFSKSEILTSDEVIKFMLSSKFNEKCSDNNVRKEIHELFFTYNDPIKRTELKNVYEILMGNIDATANAGHYYNEELVRGA